MSAMDDSSSSSPGQQSQIGGNLHKVTLGSKLTKKASLRIQKKSYREEKKKAYEELKSTILDPAVVILSDWLKIRSTLKNWSRMWCVLKPGILVLYRSSKNKQWAGTILLTSSEIIERPTKKDGFCFKIYHPLEQIIWASKGPNGESMSLLNNSLPSNHLILRAATESDGQCWMDALELARKCSHLLKKSMPSFDSPLKPQDIKRKLLESENEGDEKISDDTGLDLSLLQQQLNNLRQGRISVSDENEAENRSEDGSYQQKNDANIGGDACNGSVYGSESSQNTSQSSEGHSSDAEEDGNEIQDSKYVPEKKSETFGEAGEAAQTVVLAGENKSLIWTLLKQLRPGMDLSKVVLPTFILEPHSFLEKLSDYYYHADLISAAAINDNPFERMKAISKWYLSGFYKKPKGLKKPYNPIIGEFFRCKWRHPDTDSFTYYIAEQVSHHPPISAFALINRKDGFVVNASILAKSKFYGNSLSAILDGTAILSLLKRGEDYVITLPYAHCKGILYGTMTMEFGGKVKLSCKKTGYHTEIEFKLKPFFGGNDAVNRITGRISLGKEVLATLHGYWDQQVYITDLSDGTVSSFWAPTEEIRSKRLERYMIPMEDQQAMESQNLWQHVTAAINRNEQEEATQQKFLLEENQRKGAHERRNTNTRWVPKLFAHDACSNQWTYKYLDKRPWDDLNDIDQYEAEGCISTRTRHKTKKFVPKDENTLTTENVATHNRDWKERAQCEETKQQHGQGDREVVKPMITDTELQKTLSSIKEDQKCMMKELIQLQSVLQTQNSSNSFLLLLSNICLIILVAIFALLAYFNKVSVKM